MLMVRAGRTESRAPLYRVQMEKRDPHSGGKSGQDLGGGGKEGSVFKSRKSFGYSVGKANAKPSNTADRE